MDTGILRGNVKLISFLPEQPEPLTGWIVQMWPGLPPRPASLEEVGADDNRIVMCEELSSAVARSILDGRDLPDVLADWQQRVRIALDFCADSPQKSFLLTPEKAYHDAGGTVRDLIEWAGYSEPVEVVGPRVCFPEDVLALADVVVSEVCRLSPETSALVDKLVHAGGCQQKSAELRADRLALALESVSKWYVGATAALDKLRERETWLAQLRESLWNEADRASQAENRIRVAEAQLVEVERARQRLQNREQELLVKGHNFQTREQELLTQIAERDAVIQELYSSTSWWITEPIRQLRRSADRLRGR